MNARAARAKILQPRPPFNETTPFKAAIRVSRAFSIKKHVKVSHSKHILAINLARKGKLMVRPAR